MNQPNEPNSPDGTLLPDTVVLPARGEHGEARGPSGAPARLARYEVLGKVAEGGMGVVYQARDTQLQRLVALKLMTRGYMATASEQRRFLLEAESVAALHHPAVMPVFDYGESEDGPWFVMPLLEGGSLQTKLRTGALPPREAVTLMIPVCEGIQHAHAQGILHRDLKPGNILLDSHGAPVVADFGLAKRLGDFTQLTASGTVMGTPSYMPPEQAKGKPVNEQADIYSLGAVLYALITGRPPALADTPVEVLRQVIEEVPPRPSSLVPGVDAKLEAIIFKCLEKSATDRYGSAGELAEDLRKWERGDAVLARRSSLAASLIKWARRKPAQAAIAGISLLGTLAFIVLLIVNQFRLQHERDQTDTVRRSAEDLVGTAVTDYRQTVEANVGKLDALDQITDSAGDYFARLPDGLRDERSNILQVKLLTLRGEVLRSKRKPSEAAAVLDRAIAMIPASNSAAWQLPAAAAFIARTDVALVQDDDTRAPQFAEQALRQAATALNAAPGDMEALRSKGLALYYKARCDSKAKRPDAAQAGLEESILCAEKVSAADPDNIQKTQEYAWALAQLGKVLKNRAEGVQADLKALRKPAPEQVEEKEARKKQLLTDACDRLNAATNLLDPLLKSQPWNQPVRQAVGALHDAFGDISLLRKDTVEALKQYRSYVHETETLVSHDPKNIDWLGELAIAHMNLGGRLYEAGELKEGDLHFDQSITTRQAMMDVDATDGKLRRDYCLALLKRGDARLGRHRKDPAQANAASDTQAARSDYEAADKLALEQLKTSDSAWWESRRVSILYRRGVTYRETDKLTAIALLKEAIALAESIKQAGRNDPGAEENGILARRTLNAFRQESSDPPPAAPTGK